MTLSVAAIPAHGLAFALHPGSGAGLAAAAAAGFLNMAMVPPVVVMAQEMLPARAALGSGIVMGLAWAAASVAVIAVGVVADYTGALSAALLSVPCLLGATLLALHPSLATHARARNGFPQGRGVTPARPLRPGRELPRTLPSLFRRGPGARSSARVGARLLGGEGAVRRASRARPSGGARLSRPIWAAVCNEDPRRLGPVERSSRARSRGAPPSARPLLRSIDRSPCHV